MQPQLFINCISFTSQKPAFNIRKISLTHFGRRVQDAIDAGNLNFPKERAAFVRECIMFYEPILSQPTEEQYRAITEALPGQVPLFEGQRVAVLGRY